VLDGAGGLDPLVGVDDTGRLDGPDPVGGPNPLCGAGGAGLMSRNSEAAAIV
jgi:hypothetical protein